MRNRFFFCVVFIREREGKIINKYLFSRKNPDLKGISNIKTKNPNGTRKTQDWSPVANV